MRTLVESILDGDLDVHDEAVFTEQIIPEIIKCAPYTMRNMASEMSIKMENGKRILFIHGESNGAEITDKIIKVLENHNIYEIQSEGHLRISGTLTGFTISAPFIYFAADFQKDIILTKCDVTCDTLFTIGFNDPKIVCNRCQIKAKTYSISRTPIMFTNSKIIGLDSILIFHSIGPTAKALEDLGVRYHMSTGFTPDASFIREAPHLDPLKELAGIEKIAKSPNIYLYLDSMRTKEHRAGLIFKHSRTPIDKQVEKVIIRGGGAVEPIDCANGYEAIFTNSELLRS